MALSRRDIFRGLVDPAFWQQRRKRVPLPYLEGRQAAHATCTTCVEQAEEGNGPPCVAACPEKIIKVADDGAPCLEFERSGCTFCSECATACTPGALDLERGRLIDAVIDLNRSRCLAWSQTMCQSCADRCPDRAIVFGARLMEPAIDPGCCTHCGLCVNACPTDAITITA